ncbi:MAG: hypothetical protein JRI59_12100 [Deltaproteobacteria bacterium]|nr:hypothetical protein [Deltaproteobacteria bacterium]
MHRNLNHRLILIGTVHDDPWGYERALGLLEALLAELPEGAEEHPALRRVAARLEMPFEWRAAWDYGRRHGARWRPVDLSAPARQHLPRYARELLDPENLRRLLESWEESLEAQVAAAYRRARLSLERPLWRPPATNSKVERLRELVMAARPAGGPGPAGGPPGGLGTYSLLGGRRQSGRTAGRFAPGAAVSG